MHEIVWPQAMRHPEHQAVVGYTVHDKVPEWMPGCDIRIVEPVVEVKGKRTSRRRKAAVK